MCLFTIVYWRTFRWKTNACHRQYEETDIVIDDDDEGDEVEEAATAEAAEVEEVEEVKDGIWIAIISVNTCCEPFLTGLRRQMTLLLSKSMDLSPTLTISIT